MRNVKIWNHTLELVLAAAPAWMAHHCWRVAVGFQGGFEDIKKLFLEIILITYCTHLWPSRSFVGVKVKRSEL